MKICWFHLMPYPELPEDFRSQTRSVWVDIPSRLMEPEVVGRSYRTYLEQLEHADAVGFDGICVNEHHQNGYGLMPSPNLMASALARTTTRSALIVGGRPGRDSSVNPSRPWETNRERHLPTVAPAHPSCAATVLLS